MSAFGATFPAQLYGIVPASFELPLGVGVLDNAFQVTHDRLSAVLGLVTESRGPARALREHFDATGELAELTTVLPARFGVIMEDEAAMRADLEEHQECYLARLDALRGRVELAVKATYAEEAILGQLVAADPSLRRFTSRREGGIADLSLTDSIAIGKRVEQALELRATTDRSRIRAVLSARSVAVAEGRTGAYQFANFSCLVERVLVEQFSGVVSALEATFDGLARLDYRGPLPPFTFAGDPAAFAQECESAGTP